MTTVDKNNNNNNDVIMNREEVHAFRAREAGLAAFKELVFLKGESKLQSSSGGRRRHPVQQLDWSDLNVFERLGKGSFSEVYRVAIRTSQDPPGRACGSDGDVETEHSTNSAILEDASISLSSLRSDITDTTEDSGIDTTKDLYFYSNDDIVAPLKDDNGKDDTTNNKPTTTTTTEYALKCIRPDILNDDELYKSGTFDQAAVDMVVEGHILSRLEHDNIIQLHGIKCGDVRKAFVSKSTTTERSQKKKKPDSGYFLLLEVLEGTLTDRLEELRSKKQSKEMHPHQLWTASMDLVANAGLGVARGLSYMHR
jgi:serine/threonine protein kinase